MKVYKRNDERVKRTVLSLFNSFSRFGVDVAFWKNYENYPYIGRDLDIFMARSDLEQYRSIIVKVAKEERWEIVIEEEDYTSFGKVYAEHFRLFDFKTFDCLEIDVMHRYEVKGIEVFKESFLLSSILHNKGAPHFAPEIELFLRFTQIPSLLKSKKPDTEKINRYVSIYKKLYGSCEKSANYAFSFFGDKAKEVDKEIRSPNKRNKVIVKKYNELTRWLFIKNFFIEFLGIYKRFSDLVHQVFIIKPASNVLFINCDDSLKRKIDSFLEKLTQHNIIISFYIHDSQNGFSLKKWMWTQRARGMWAYFGKKNILNRRWVRIDGKKSFDEIKREILKGISSRGKVIYRNNEF